MEKSLVIKIIFALAITAIVSYNIGAIRESTATHNKRMSCLKKYDELRDKKPDLYEKFYGHEHRSYYHIRAFIDYQLEECYRNHEMFGEDE